MQYNYYFDLCGLIIEIMIIFLMMIKPRIKTATQNIFIALVISTMLTTGAETNTAYILEHSSEYSAGVVSGFMHFYYATFMLTAFAYFTYMMSLTKRLKNFTKNKLLVVIGFLPFAAAEIGIITNPFFGFFFEITDECVYIQKGGRYFLYIVAMFYLLISAYYALTCRNVLSRRRLVSLALISFIAAGAAIIWLLIPTLLVELFAIAVGLLMALFLVQNPEDDIDSATRLFNRVSFSTVAGRKYEIGSEFFTVTIRFENTLFIEKTFGTEVMQKVYILCVKYFKSVMPKKAMLFRIRENRFCFMLKNMTDEEAARFAYEVNRRFRSDFICDGFPITVQAYVQVTKCPEDAASIEALMDVINISSDVFGSNSAPLFSSSLSMGDSRARKIAVEQALDSAVKFGSVQVHYQPVYSTKTGKVVYIEALARIIDDQFGFIMPDEFIPIAEKRGYIQKIGFIVFEKVCDFISKNDISAFGIKYVQVNLSAVQCLDSELAERLLDISMKYEIDPSQINLEITEYTAANTTDVLMTNIAMLYNRGFSFTLDDYGIGYTDMRCLIDLPFRMVKLDKSMVWSADSSTNARIILECTVNMIRNMNLAVTAEGVESEQQEKMLLSMGCEEMQGFYFSRPINETELLAVLQNA